MTDGPFSFAHLGNLSYIEDVFEKYKKDPSSIESSWRHFFEGMEFVLQIKEQVSKSSNQDLRVYLLIDSFRKYGHLSVDCNPINPSNPTEIKELKADFWGFKEEELQRDFPTFGFLKEQTASLQKIIEALQNTYCKNIGIEYVGIGNLELEKWIQEKIEPGFPLGLTSDEKLSILYFLNKAEIFETFIHTKYVGQKRFSLEGGESLIPMLSALLEKAGTLGVSEVVLGMAHRGRLNVLANILNKSYTHIFHEFEDHYTPDLLEGTGDVKYHKGFEGVYQTKLGKSLKILLSANPSHLESVDPVAEGQARALQELKRDKKRKREVVPILIHGDASVSGQGVVYETMQLCRLNGYKTEGTVHIVVNNQIGFTTLPKDSRSTRYCTDLAKAFGCPVFHVNAEEPEECIVATKLAIEIRQKFGCDVFIDLNCYRKYGHNESDEPSFTQPLQYKIIKAKKSIRELFKLRLIQEGILHQEQANKIEEEFKQELRQALEKIPIDSKTYSLEEMPLEKHAEIKAKKATAVAKDVLVKLAEKFCSIPEGFLAQPKVQKLLKERLLMVNADSIKPVIDWGMGEHLAFATLLEEGIHVRLSGQDSRRGTFTHRHASIVDFENGASYFPLSHLSSTQAPFDVFNSPLSEFAVMGFEFGYSLLYPDSLVIWEAQFGDFVNGAQIIVDQYLSGSEQKWSHKNNLTLMLPHGYEGQGPEHSSARVERFLQLAGENNFIIANCTTPSQLFHILRRQAYLENKKPLILFTPKALLRHPECVSKLKDFSEEEFEEVLDDSLSSKDSEKVLFCTGKIYYDLALERQKRNQSTIAIIRIEQLYPLHKQKIENLVSKYSKAKMFAFVQEEHSNMGAWEFIRSQLQEFLPKGKTLEYFGRDRSASTAAGSYALHKMQYQKMMDRVFKES